VETPFFSNSFPFPLLYKQAQAGNSMSSTAQTQEYVTLVSGDGFEFVVPRSTACVSGTIRRMLDPSSKLSTPLYSFTSFACSEASAKHILRIGNFSEAITGRCVLETLSGVVLEKVCEYFCYNHKNKEQANVPDMEIPPELCLELLMAADYLDT